MRWKICGDNELEAQRSTTVCPGAQRPSTSASPGDPIVVQPHIPGTPAAAHNDEPRPRAAAYDELESTKNGGADHSGGAYRLPPGQGMPRKATTRALHPREALRTSDLPNRRRRPWIRRSGWLGRDLARGSSIQVRKLGKIKLRRVVSEGEKKWICPCDNRDLRCGRMEKSGCVRSAGEEQIRTDWISIF